MHIIIRIIIPICFLLSQVHSGAQEMADPEKRDHLIRISAGLEREYLSAKEYAVSFAGKNNLPIRRVFSDGTVMELQYIGDDGLPVYYTTLNAGAAVTTGTSDLHPGGSLRMLVTGKGSTAGVWDAGRFEATHPEYSGRLIPRDAAKPVSDHAMHVAGTVMAKGINPAARGMAYESTVLGYDWDNDLSQMASAAAEGLIVSNHSYGIKLGWEQENGDWKWYGHQDSIHDYRFGYYSNKSRRLDEIVFNAPYYSIVWAAGNDRNDTGDGTRTPDGPYNCIGPEASAKNVFAIGAVQKIPGGYNQPSDVKISSFSSWGPTDDGRVKPDLVAAGVSLFSTISGDAYTNMSGTSVAAPNVTGSLLLLQQLYSLYNNDMLMKNSTVRALAIHTVNQAGSSKGPDYSYGWGLLNTVGAARLIISEDGSDFIIAERTLSENEVFEIEFDADGTGSIIATMAWTDPPGTPTDYSADPHRLMLVNDLDMRIYDEEENEYLPWILDPAFPADAATRGDNFRDNVEKILIEQPQSGRYRLVVTHKNGLKNGVQDFSLILQTRDVPTRESYYWIGGNGDWHDPANWSQTSGGDAAETVPGIEDHVVFDANSFTDDNQFAVISEPAWCYSFNWYGDMASGIMFNEDTLTVVSSFYSENNKLGLSGNGTIYFTGDRQNSFIKFPDNETVTIILSFNNPEGAWSVISPLRAGEIHLMAGTVLSADKIMHVKRIRTSTEEYKMFDLKGSVLNEMAFIEFLGENLFLNIDNTVFNFTGDEDAGSFLIAEEMEFHEVNNLSGELSAEGSNLFGNLTNDDILVLKGSNTINNLMLREGTLLLLQDGTSQNITGNFQATGQADEMIEISSIHNEQAYLESFTGRKFCLEYLVVDNVSVMGNSIFNAGINSLIDDNSQGWSQVACDEVLFADFTVSYKCVDSWTFFQDRSTGMIENWEWDFDLGNQGIYTADIRNPWFTYTSAGNYNVSLKVSDEQSSHENVKDISIIDNPLSAPEIVVIQNTYTSSRSAPYYQWYRDGKPIEGATSRSYTNTDELPGSYQVLISNNVCNRVSEPLVTSSPVIENIRNKKITVFPNPAKEFILIQGNLEQDGTVLVEMIDIPGRVVFSEYYRSHLIDGTRIDVSNYLPGIYIIKLTAGRLTETFRILIQ